jgi:transcription antitermination factor NusG
MGGSYGFSQLATSEVLSIQPTLLSMQWFAIETRIRFEKKVASQLTSKGFQVFLPLLTEHHQWSDRQKAITFPIFPGYAFVCLDQSKDSSRAVLRTAGLIRFVSFGGIVSPIPQKQIEDLRLLLQEKSPIALHPFIQVGQRVRIRSGCLQGLEGILLHHEKEKLIISIQSIQRSVAVEIRGYELEPAPCSGC